MRPPPPPLRFLALVGGVWIGSRVFALMPDWTEEAEASEVAVLPASSPPGVAAEQPTVISPAIFPTPRVERRTWTRASLRLPLHLAAALRPPTSFAAPSLVRRVGTPHAQPAANALFIPPPPPELAQIFPRAAPAAPPERRFAGSAWLFLRNGDEGPGLAPAGVLGGSQAGLRLSYRLAGRRAPLALSARAYLPLGRPQGAEAAVGLDWRPVPAVPIHILAERREALGRDGRSDFALTLYGGGDRRIGPVRIEAWGQAGAVGTDKPDLFADALVRTTVRAGPLQIGAGAWGGAQPGASRLDVGPHVSARLPVAGANLRVIAEWRVRVAGDAAPGSGPALTIASDF